MDDSACHTPSRTTSRQEVVLRPLPSRGVVRLQTARAGLAGECPSTARVRKSISNGFSLSPLLQPRTLTTLYPDFPVLSAAAYPALIDVF
jgi:hypothetical protein